MPAEAQRASLEALLALAKKEGRGHLKILLGAAPGVGKTYAMLTSARTAKTEGRYVVVGLPDGDGKDVFVHISAVQRAGMDDLREGAKVTFDIVDNLGKPVAYNLRVKISWRHFRETARRSFACQKLRPSPLRLR